MPERPLRRRLVPVIFLSALGIAAAYLSALRPGGAPAWATFVMVAAIGVILVAMMTLGALPRDGRLGGLGWAFAFTFLVVVGGLGAVLLMPADDPADPVLWLGLPPRAAVVLLGVGLLPVAVLPLAYALTFDRVTLRPGELERVREAARAARRDGGDA